MNDIKNKSQAEEPPEEIDGIIKIDLVYSAKTSGFELHAGGVPTVFVFGMLGLAFASVVKNQVMQTIQSLALKNKLSDLSGGPRA